MTPLSAFGLLAVTAMLVCYTFEARSSWFVLGFAVSCGLLGSTYGSLQGAWPFGIVEAVWAFVALRRWRAVVRGTDDLLGATASAVTGHYGRRVDTGDM